MKKVLCLIFASLVLFLSFSCTASAADMDKIFSVNLTSGSVEMQSVSNNAGTTDGGVPAFQTRHMSDLRAISLNKAVVNFGEQGDAYVTEIEADATGTFIGNVDWEEKFSDSSYTATLCEQTAAGGSVVNAKSLTGLATTGFNCTDQTGVNFSMSIGEFKDAKVKAGVIEKTILAIENEEDDTVSLEIGSGKDMIEVNGSGSEFNFQNKCGEFQPASSADDIGIDPLCPGTWSEDTSIQNFIPNFFSE